MTPAWEWLDARPWLVFGVGYLAALGAVLWWWSTQREDRKPDDLGVDALIERRGDSHDGGKARG
jgi:hypothetical protein